MSTPERESTVDDLSGLTSHASKSTDTPPRDVPPRAKTRATGTGSRPSATSRAKLETKLTEFFGTTALFVGALVNQQDGEIILKNAESLAFNWAALAEENASVKRVLNSLMETNAWSGAILATAAVAIPIMDNHGFIPERYRSFVPSAPSPDATAGGTDNVD